MASTSFSSASTISEITGFCAYADVRVGSNGAPDGSPEYDVGSLLGSAVSGRIVWTSDLSDGFSSGFVQVRLDAAPGGGSNGVRWEVVNGSPQTIVYNGVQYGSIQEVQIRAAVLLAAKMIWRAVSVSFFKGGVQTDGVSLRGGPQVDTTGGIIPITAEQILTVIPDATDNDEVVIVAEMELACPLTTLVQPNDIFGQIFVFADNCVNV